MVISSGNIRRQANASMQAFTVPSSVVGADFIASLIISLATIASSKLFRRTWKNIGMRSGTPVGEDLNGS